MQIKINNKIYDAAEGKTILQVCRENKVYIPTLCFHQDLLPSEGLCRMCLVKTNQHRGLVTSCQTNISDHMEIVTEDEDIAKARKINLELLWADHAGKCSQCSRNGDCELQNLAGDLKIEVKDFVPTLDQFEKEEQLKLLKESLKNRVVDDKNPSIFRDNQYCIECRRCVKACRDIQTIESYGMNYRSIETKVGTPGEIPLDCIFCGQCANYCPTAAITEKSQIDEIEKVLQDDSKLKVVQIAPSVRFTLGEEFGLEPGTFVEGKMVSALREIGIDLVFDTTFSADLTIMEEAHELLERLNGKIRALEQNTPKSAPTMPMFTSCCPSWVLYVEKYWPQFIPNLSSCKSPQQMLGALAKTYYPQTKHIHKENVSSISIMPCTSKKFEAKREEMGRDGLSDVDIVLTTRELARLIKKKRINFLKLPEGFFDKSLGIYSGAGLLFGSTGGVMEAALRTAYETLTCEQLPKLDFVQVRGQEGIRSASITIPKGKCSAREVTLKVAVAHEIRNASKILKDLERGVCEYDFVEVMACPGGCLGGGGQPIPTSSEIRAKRREAIYQRDKGLPLRKSHENPAIKHLYEEFLQTPGSQIAERLLHTKYIPRKTGQ